MRRLVPVLLVVGLLVVGCTPGGGTPSPSPSSPVLASPSPSATPTPTPSAVSSEDALYAEAERVLRRAYELSAAFELRGDYTEFPAELEDLAADPYLGWLKSLFETGKEQGWHAPEGSETKVDISPLPGVSREGSEVALQVCVDSRGSPLLDGNGNLLSEGRIAYDKVFFKTLDGRLKVFTSTTEVVDTCPF